LRDQKLRKSITYIGIESATVMDYQRQSTDVSDRRSAACWKPLPVVRIQRIVKHWFYITANICANSYKISMTSQSFPTTFSWPFTTYHTLFFVTFQAWKMVLLNSITFCDVPWPGDTLYSAINSVRRSASPLPAVAKCLPVSSQYIPTPSDNRWSL